MEKTVVTDVENVESLQGSVITLMPGDEPIMSDQVYYVTQNEDFSNEISLTSTPTETTSNSVELQATIQQMVDNVTNEVEIRTGEVEGSYLQEVEIKETGGGPIGQSIVYSPLSTGVLSTNYVIDGDTILDVIEDPQTVQEVQIMYNGQQQSIKNEFDGIATPSIKAESPQIVGGEGTVHIRKYDTEEVTFHIYQSPDTLAPAAPILQNTIPKNNLVKGPFKCPVCFQAFAKESSLKLHKRLHYNPSRCKTCGKCFAQSSQLRAHSVIHSGVRPYKCAICNKAFHYSSSLITHKRIHSKEKPYKCPHCDKSFLQSGNLTSHLMMHIKQEQKIFDCDKCEKKFDSQEEWNAHFENYHKSDKSHSDGFMCDLCGKYFRNKQYKVTHMLSHREGTLECPQCGKTVKNEKTLASHIAYVHSGVPRFMCDECGKLYTSRQSLRQHLKLHTTEYGMAKARRKEMVEHVDQEVKTEKKTEKKPHHCEQCGKVFTEKRHLKDHLLIHDGKKDHVCSVCGRSFRQKSTLTRHMKVHTGEKKYECGECGKTFREMANVKDHQLAVHLKIRPHTCQHCGKSFSLPLTLKKHLLTHSEDKDWFCFQCGKAFKCEQHLKNHTLVHNENRETYDCDYCMGTFKRPVCLKKHLQRCPGVPVGHHME